MFVPCVAQRVILSLSFRASRSSARRNDGAERNPEDAYQTMLIQGISSMVSRFNSIRDENNAHRNMIVIHGN
jgi:hypothetical protein